MAAENDIETEAIVMGISPKIAWQLQLVAGIITLVLGAILAFHPTFSLNVVCPAGGHAHRRWDLPLRSPARSR